MLGNLQVYTKLIAVLLGGALLYVNQRWGLAFPVDQPTLIAIITPILALFVVASPPNKPTQNQAAQIVADARTDPVIQAKATNIVAADKASDAADAAVAKAQPKP